MGAPRIRQSRTFSSVEEAASHLLELYGPGTLAEANHMAYFVHSKPPKAPYAPPTYAVTVKRKPVKLVVYWAGKWEPTPSSGWKVIKEVKNV